MDRKTCFVIASYTMRPRLCTVKTRYTKSKRSNLSGRDIVLREARFDRKIKLATKKEQVSPPNWKAKRSDSPLPQRKTKKRPHLSPLDSKEEDAIADVHTRQDKRKSSLDESPSTMTRRLRSRTNVYTSKS